MNNTRKSEPEEKYTFGDRVFDSIMTMGITIIACLLLSTVVRTVVVSGQSMEPNYHNREVLLVRMNPDTSKLKYGDIVIAQKSDYELIKRVIGLPGDKLECHDGVLKRNGKIVKEPYIREKQNRDFTATIKKNHVFICGDNRNNSMDSRYFGQINMDRLHGRVITKLFQLPEK